MNDAPAEAADAIVVEDAPDVAASPNAGGEDSPGSLVHQGTIIDADMAQSPIIPSRPRSRMKPSRRRTMPASRRLHRNRTRTSTTSTETRRCVTTRPDHRPRPPASRLQKKHSCVCARPEK